MFVTLTEVVENTTRTTINEDVARQMFTLREVTINPEYVVCVREDTRTNQLFSEGKLPEGLDPRQRFTRIYMDRGQSGIDVVVVGEPNAIESTLDRARSHGKEILHG